MTITDHTCSSNPIKWDNLFDYKYYKTTKMRIEYFTFKICDKREIKNQTK